MKDIKIGFIGLGERGIGLLKDIILEQGEKVTAVCDTYSDRAQQGADAVEAKAAVKAALLMDGPVYMRFGRYAVPVINDAATYEFELGRGVLMNEGSDVS